MITVSLQPFAFRKIIILIAAVLWLTATALFADPLFMNASATRIAQHSQRSAPAVHVVAKAPAAAPAPRAIEQTRIAPAEGPTPFSLSLERLDTWAADRHQPFVADPELTFWSVSLAR